MSPTEATSRERGRKRLAVGGLLLLATALDLGLLHSLLTWKSLASGETLRAYYEPEAAGIALMLDHQQAGYITELEVDGADLLVPSGRTIAIPLEDGTEVTVRTLATDLAPYIVLGWEQRTNERADATRFADGSVFAVRASAFEAEPWNPSLPWLADKQWLRDLHARCGLAAQAEVAIRAQADGVVIRAGSCSGTLRRSVSTAPLLVVVAGPRPAVVSSSGPGWRQTRVVLWSLAALVPARILLLAFAVGSGPTVIASGVLFLVGQFWRTAAILAWITAIPVIVAAAAARLLAVLFPRSTGLAWIGGTLVLALEAVGIFAAIAFLDVGTFGNEHITRAGDDHCSIVGYSTVRGDSLRRGSGGVVERLGDSCSECRNRTSRFSREAQTLRWVRAVTCSETFPAPAGSEVVFLGGGNDDLFYRPTGLRQLLVDFAGTLRFAVARPVGATNWEDVFDRVNERVVVTLDDQAADIEAIIGCATKNGRRFHFVHDFLVWDLDHGRPAARQRTFERRRAAVLSAGGEFIDLLEEFRQSAGVAWLNDFIHPSAVGQREIADLLCDRLANGG